MNYERAQEISSSQNWAAIVEELDLWIKSEESKLRHCIPDQLVPVQIAIHILEKVRNLPQIVIDREG